MIFIISWVLPADGSSFMLMLYDVAAFQLGGLFIALVLGGLETFK